MSSVNDQAYAYPEATPNLNNSEKSRLSKNFEKLKERLRATCRHLIKAPDTPWRKPRWGSKRSFRSYLNASGSVTIDPASEILADPDEVEDDEPTDEPALAGDDE